MKISHNYTKKLINSYNSQTKKKWRIHETLILLGIAKALTGGLHIVITATPSLPTSKSTLTDAIFERNCCKDPKLGAF